MPASLARICPAVSFWNFSSAAALDPKIAMARSASFAVWTCVFIFDVILGRLPAISRFLKDRFQWHIRELVSELDIFSGDPNLIAAPAGLFSRFEAKFVVVDQPFSNALVAHGSNGKSAGRLEDLAPMRFIGQFHASEFCAYLR